MTLKSRILPIDQNRKIQPITWLVIAYIFTVVFYMLVNGYCKHIETYGDERIYYSMAEGLAKGLGFPTMVGEPFDYMKRYLYSILISPAFLVRNRLLQFRLIALINALVMCSGAFPTYLLAKEVLKNSRTALLAGVLYLLQPDLQFTASFMSENLWLPLALWVVFFSYQLTSGDSKDFKKKSGYLVGWFLASTMLVYVKSSGYVVVLSSGIWFVVFLASRLVRNALLRNATRKQRLLWIFTVLFIVAAGSVFILFSWLWKEVLAYIQNRILNRWSSRPWLHIRCYLFAWASEALAIGIFPMVLPLISFRKLSKEGRTLFLFLLLLTSIANFGITYTSVRSQEIYPWPDFPLYHRYIIYIWLPYLIVFFDSLKSEVRPSILWIGLVITLAATFCIQFQGAIIGSAFEASLLWWAKGWMQHRRLWIVLVMLYTTIGFFLLHFEHKYFIAFFSVIMLCLQGYNHFAMHEEIHNGYQFSYHEINDVESFITANPDKNILVAIIPTSRYFDNVHYNAKVADTYLLYPNSFFVADTTITGAETENGINLSNIEAKLTARTDLRSVDYVILTNEMSIDQNSCEPVIENRYFTVYKLDDPTQIPYMKRIKWGEEGTTIMSPWNAFGSLYSENGTIVFTSGEMPSYVLYGPYVTLPPGTYSVTIHYTYDGEQDGRIGLMDLMGSAFAEGEYEAPAFSNQDSVTLSFELDMECTNFETRLFAEAAGITVESIEVEYAAPRSEKAAAELAPAA